MEIFNLIIAASYFVAGLLGWANAPAKGLQPPPELNQPLQAAATPEPEPAWDTGE
jgi:hypothetical protein